MRFGILCLSFVLTLPVLIIDTGARWGWVMGLELWAMGYWCYGLGVMY